MRCTTQLVVSDSGYNSLGFWVLGHRLRAFPILKFKILPFQKNAFKLLFLTLKYLSHLRFMLLDGAVYKHSERFPQVARGRPTTS